MESPPALTTSEAAEDVCRLVTTGRHSGAPHDIEIWFGPAGSTVYFISGNGPDADWYRNAMDDADVEVRVGQRRFRGRARAVTAADERRLVGDLMGERHRGWGGDPDIGLTFEAWCYQVPALAVDLVEAEPI